MNTFEISLGRHVNFNVSFNSSYNASRIYYLHPVQLDTEIYAPESVLIMLLTSITMMLTLFLFCLLTNPVPEVKDNGPKKASTPGKKKKKNRLKIDWSVLKVSKVKLDILSKIEMAKNASEGPTLQGDPSSSSASSSGGSAQGKVKQNQKKNLSDAVNDILNGQKHKSKKNNAGGRSKK